MFSLVAHPDEGGNQSLHDLVHGILDELSEVAKISFLDVLDQLGYIVGHPSMEEFRYNLTHGDGKLYAVCGDFRDFCVKTIQMMSGLTSAHIESPWLLGEIGSRCSVSLFCQRILEAYNRIVLPDQEVHISSISGLQREAEGD